MTRVQSKGNTEVGTHSDADEGVGSAGAESPAFAHPSESEFAHILDFYGLRWVYEPRSFPLRWDGERVIEMLTPGLLSVRPGSVRGVDHDEAEPGYRGADSVA